MVKESRFGPGARIMKKTLQYILCRAVKLVYIAYLNAGLTASAPREGVYSLRFSRKNQMKDSFEEKVNKACLT